MHGALPPFRGAVPGQALHLLHIVAVSCRVWLPETLPKVSFTHDSLTAAHAATDSVHSFTRITHRVARVSKKAIKGKAERQQVRSGYWKSHIGSLNCLLTRYWLFAVLQVLDGVKLAIRVPSKAIEVVERHEITRFMSKAIDGYASMLPPFLVSFGKHALKRTSVGKAMNTITSIRPKK